ncbi:hypothetical protein OAR14_00470 [bacterium]|jgi:3-hydroxyacyl-[acyl-carrier-protein] dehydratase|nr:hypothetical protein [bacterium]
MLKIIKSKKKLINILQIDKPFLMIDSFKNKRKGYSGIAEKIITKNDWYFKSHFLNNPIFPGTLQTEAMLQSIIIILNIKNKFAKKNYMITKINTNHFSSIKGEGKLKILSKIISHRRGAIEAISNIQFNKENVSEGKFKFFCPSDLIIK